MIYQGMLNRVFTITLLAVVFLSCATITTHFPKMNDKVDEEAVSLVNEYKQLAEIMHIKLNSKIGVHFAKIEEPLVIGLCYRAPFFRQIELDTAFWHQADSNQRLALIFHELTHCYCGRNHDYKGGSYPESDREKAKEQEVWIKNKSRPGYWDDSCPISLMSPVIVDSVCVQLHYNEYIQEMFDRCKPY